MITKAKSKRTNGKKPKAKNEYAELAAEVAALPSKNKKATKPIAPEETERIESRADIHQITQDAVTLFCNRLLDRAVRTIMEDAAHIALYLPDCITTEFTDYFNENFDVGEKMLAEFELRKAQFAKPELDEFVGFEASRMIWWPFVAKLREEAHEYQFNSLFRDSLNLAVACMAADSKDGNNGNDPASIE